jgi:predicted permease
MSWLSRIRALLRLIFKGRTAETDLDDEVQDYFETMMARQVENGVPLEEARRLTRLKFGAPERVKEKVREVRIGGAGWHELRIPLRRLLNSPGFTTAGVLMLAFGIGVTTAMFSVVEGVLLRPLPFPHPERLVELSDIIQGSNGESGVTAPDIRAYVRNTHSFDALGGYQQVDYELSGIGEPARVRAARMSAGVFPALGIAPLLGRVFTQQEDDQREQVAVISDTLWRNRLHGDAQVLGTKVFLNRKPYTVIGVMPRDFEFPLMPGHLNNSELWVPMSFTAEELTNGAASWNFGMVGRLKVGITAVQAESDAEQAALEIMRSYPAFMSGMHIQALVRSLQEQTVDQVSRLIRTLFLATTVVLLIVCANLAGLMLVRGIRRRRQITLQLALGAPAGTLLREAVLESLLLNMTGGVLGVGLAAITLRVGLSVLPETLPRIREIGIDWKVVLFALGLSVVTGVLCGVAPAFAALRTKVNDNLKEGGRTGTAGAHGWLSTALVAGEIAVALVLLATSGLLLRSFEKMLAVDLGFRPDHLLTASYSLPEQQYRTQSTVDEFNHELLRRVQQLPGVKLAGLTSFLPASGGDSNTVIEAEGYLAPKGAPMNLATQVMVQGDYLQAIGVPLLAGRTFTAADAADSQLVAIVNYKLAEHCWPGVNPIGKHLRLGLGEGKLPWLTVVGEVADVKESSPDLPSKQQYYTPLAQYEKSIGPFASPIDVNGTGASIVMRTAMEPGQMVNALRATVRSIDSQLPLTHVQSMESMLSMSESSRRFYTTLISAFALVAALLAGLGTYSVIAFLTALRTQELAIRMALGAQRTGVVCLVFASAARVAIIGCAVGIVGVAAVSRLVGSFLFGVTPFDPLALAVAAVFVLILASLASLLPARRAASIDPMRILRAE